MSDLQVRWWASERVFPDPSLVMPTQMRVRGSLDRARIETAAQAVAQRHEALRTTFGRVDGWPAQVIRSAPHQPLTWFHDLSETPVAERTRALTELLTAEQSQRFDLARGPLMRLGIIRCSADDHILALTLHHIIADGWAVGVVWRELSQAYENSVREAADGAGPSWPQAPRLRDWVAAERRMLQGPVAAREIAYWSRILRRIRPLHLPHDLPGDGTQPRRPRTRRFTFSQELVDALHASHRRFRATPYMLTLTAFVQLLGQHTRRRDVAVMTLLNRRGDLDTAHLVGCVFNHATISVVIPADRRPESLVGEVRGVLLDTYDHQEVNAHRIWRETGFPPGSVDVMFIFDEGTHEEDGLLFDGVRAEPYAEAEENEPERPGPTTPAVKFRLELNQGRLIGAIGYDGNLYSEAFIEGLLSEYSTLLGALVRGETFEDHAPTDGRKCHPHG
ncbi:condensation domain-containing protein [Streptomyces sp. NPDC088251]|uniref:condensation domain-containing protein n=1 Tax=unclassified Streptomyces TaxID=2593676 RepID=UPI0037F6F63B